MAKHPKVLNHVGLPFSEPPGTAGLPFIKSSENSGRTRRKVCGGPAHYYTIPHRRADGCPIPKE